MTEMVKRCTDCGTVKPWSEYWAKKKNPDGSMARPMPMCKPCSLARSRAWQQANRERVRAQQKESRERRTDEQIAFRLEYQREWLRKKKGAVKDRYRVRTAPTKLGRSSGLIPVAPFREWCRRRIDEEGLLYTEFAARIGLTERRLNEHLSGRTRFVPLDVVDRALLSDGWHLSQVYPDLYPDATPEVVGLLQLAAAVEAREAWEEEAATSERRVAA